MKVQHQQKKKCCLYFRTDLSVRFHYFTTFVASVHIWSLLLQHDRIYQTYQTLTSSTGSQLPRISELTTSPFPQLHYTCDVHWYNTSAGTLLVGDYFRLAAPTHSQLPYKFKTSDLFADWWSAGDKGTRPTWKLRITNLIFSLAVLNMHRAVQLVKWTKSTVASHAIPVGLSRCFNEYLTIFKRRLPDNWLPK